MMETIDRELADIQVIGERMLALVTGVLRALEIYDLGNGTVQSLIRELVEITEEYAGDHGTGLCLLQDGENMFCNQEFLRLDRRVFDKVTRLETAFAKLGVNQMELHQGVTTESLTAFFAKAVEAMNNPTKESLRYELAYGGEYMASLQLVEGISKKGGGDDDKEEVCLRMYATLEILTRDFLHQATQQTFPPVVRIRRVLQRLVDLLETHGDFVLSLVNQGRSQGTLSGHLTRASLLAAAIAQTMGVERRRIAQVSVGVFLAHLPLVRLGDGWKSADHNQLEYVFDQTLADTVNRGQFTERTAWNLAILHELQTTTLRSGEAYGSDLTISMDGRIAAIAALYDRIRAGLGSESNAREAGPAAAVAQLAAVGRQQKDAPHPYVDWRIVAMLVRLMGTLPPGSLVRLRDGSTGVIRQRPEVIVITNRHGIPLDVPIVTTTTGAQPIELPEGLDLAPFVGFANPVDTV